MVVEHWWVNIIEFGCSNSEVDGIVYGWYEVNGNSNIIADPVDCYFIVADYSVDVWFGIYFIEDSSVGFSDCDNWSEVASSGAGAEWCGSGW